MLGSHNLSTIFFRTVSEPPVVENKLELLVPECGQWGDGPNHLVFLEDCGSTRNIEFQKLLSVQK